MNKYWLYRVPEYWEQVRYALLGKTGYPHKVVGCKNEPCDADRELLGLGELVGAYDSHEAAYDAAADDSDRLIELYGNGKERDWMEGRDLETETKR